MMQVLEAVGILSGYIVGGGMFALPFAFAAVGFWLGAFELLVLAGVVLLYHLLYMEVVLGTAAPHRFPGYIKTYLGRYATSWSWFSALVGTVGTLLAYVILGSLFLQNIFQSILPSVSMLGWVLVLVVLGAAIVFFPMPREAAINSVLTALLFLFAVVLIAALASHIRPTHFSGINPNNLFVPYGILLFALSGATVIPDIVTLLGRNRTASRRAVLVGTLAPALLYFFFALAVVGAVGPGVSKEAIRSVAGVAGGWLFLVGSIVGFLAIFTSYIALSSSFHRLLRIDVGIPSIIGWGLAFLIPLGFYLAGFQDFLPIMGIVGVFSIGIDAALLMTAYHVMRRRQGAARSWFAYVWTGAVWVLIVAGVVFELSQLL